MGPVLLPTPLLPARGLLFRRTFQEALGARCLISQRVGSISSPALAPASGFASLLVLLFLTEVFPSGICLSTLPRPIPLRGCFSQAAGFRRSVFPPSIHNQVPGLSSGSAIAFSSINLACFQFALSACLVSKTAWTITTASVVLRNSREINSLEPDFRLGFSPFRCLETAPSE